MKPLLPFEKRSFYRVMVAGFLLAFSLMVQLSGVADKPMGAGESRAGLTATIFSSSTVCDSLYEQDSATEEALHFLGSFGTVATFASDFCCPASSLVFHHEDVNCDNLPSRGPPFSV